MKKGNGKIGLREIAYSAHVSVATVSRVLNGNHRVDPAIQKTVLDAAAKLNAHISPRIKNKALLFLLSNRKMLHAFDSRVLVGAEGHCAKHGWDIMFLSFNYSPNVPWKELHLPAVVRRRQAISGVILAGTNSANLVGLLTHHGIPSVVLGNNILGTSQNVIGNDVVFSDDIGGAQDMTQYLISMGHRYIWFVGNTRFPWFARCFDGYSHAMEEAGLVPCQSSIDSEDDTEIGYLGTKSLLSRGVPVTAIFSGNDTTAHGVYKALRDSGVKIPDDISVAGCDDTVGRLLYPQLTTVREFPEQLGKQMAQLILDRITSPSQDPQRVTIPTALVKRDSCRPIDSSDSEIKKRGAIHGRSTQSRQQEARRDARSS
jgi:DNA-binding LacI/PurR family transcriptional regulator